MSKAFVKESDSEADLPYEPPAIPAGIKNYMTPQGHRQMQDELNAASHNLLKPCPSLARWSGSRRRRSQAELLRPDLGLRTRIHRASTSQLAAALPRTLSDLPTPNYTTAGVRKGPGGTIQWKRSGWRHSPTG